MDADSFLLALRCFVAQRRKPTSEEIENCREPLQHLLLKDQLAEQSISFRFNPPHALHDAKSPGGDRLRHKLCIATAPWWDTGGGNTIRYWRIIYKELPAEHSPSSEEAWIHCGPQYSWPFQIWHHTSDSLNRPGLKWQQTKAGPWWKSSMIPSFKSTMQSEQVRLPIKAKTHN